MKIKSIVSICKREKRFCLYDDERAENAAQWLGDGSAVYPLLKMPPLDKESIFAVFDIPDKQASKMFVRQEPLPVSIDFRDAVECENVLKLDEMEIGFAGRVLQPLHTSQGLQFIDTKYLEPLAEYKDMLALYERTDTSGQTYIAAKNGLILVAVIMPFDAINEKFVQQLQAFTRDCKVALEIKQERERQNGQGAADR